MTRFLRNNCKDWLLLAVLIFNFFNVVHAQVQLDSICVERKGLRERLDSMVLASKMLQTSQMGLMVYDLDADTVVYERDGRQTLRPASTMKLITAITALDRLGADYEYCTRLAYTGEITGDSILTIQGDVYLVGGMDPLIGERELAIWADSLRTLGIDTIRGNLYADRSMKDGDLYGEGWCWDDDNPMLSPLVYNRKDGMAEAFSQAMRRAGICLAGRVEAGICPKNSELLIETRHTLKEVLNPMMKESNNLYAETVFYHTGLTQGKPSTAKKAAKVEDKMLEVVMRAVPTDDRERGVPPHRIADGSGLSLYNYVTAEIEVAFLRYAYQDKAMYYELYETLPVAGIDGTLKDRMKGTAAAGNVRAKTGTLSGVSSLAGYCKGGNGNMLAFAIINQGVMRGAYAKALQDKICVEMTRE